MEDVTVAAQSREMWKNVTHSPDQVPACEMPNNDDDVGLTSTSK